MSARRGKKQEAMAQPTNYMEPISPIWGFEVQARCMEENQLSKEVSAV